MGRPTSRRGMYETITLQIRTDLLALVDSNNVNRRKFIEHAILHELQLQRKGKEMEKTLDILNAAKRTLPDIGSLVQIDNPYVDYPDPVVAEIISYLVDENGKVEMVRLETLISKETIDCPLYKVEVL